MDSLNNHCNIYISRSWGHLRNCQIYLKERYNLLPVKSYEGALEIADQIENSSTNIPLSLECIVCKSKLRNIVVLPCSHLCMCIGCMKTMKRVKLPNPLDCPVCMKRITNYYPVIYGNV